jgi:hypothetical protein
MPAFKPVPIHTVLTTDTTNVSLFSTRDVELLKQEMSNQNDYKELYYDTSTGNRLWAKINGEGSGTYNENETYYDTKAAQSKCIRHRYTCEFDCTVELFYDVYRDYRYRVEWDPRDIGRKIVQVYNYQQQQEQQHQIIQTQVVEHVVKKGMFPVSNRDAVVLCADYWEGNTCYIVGKSIEHPQVGEPDSGNVRSLVLYMGLCLEPIDDGKRMRYWCVTQVDPCGWIPSSFMSWALKFIPAEFRAEMIKGIETRLKKEPSQLIYINYYKLLNGQDNNEEEHRHRKDEVYLKID